MAKRKPLTFDSKGLSYDLKASTGQGVDALFSPTPVAHTVAKTGKNLVASKPSTNSKEFAKDKRKNKGHQRLGKHVDKKTRKHVNKQVNKSTSKHVYIDSFLKKKAFSSVSFRLPPEIMKEFNRLYHHANGKYTTEIKRYSIIVAALAAFLWDFEVNGEKSDFYKLLVGDEKDKK